MVTKTRHFNSTAITDNEISLLDQDFNNSLKDLNNISEKEVYKNLLNSKIFLAFRGFRVGILKISEAFEDFEDSGWRILRILRIPGVDAQNI